MSKKIFCLLLLLIMPIMVFCGCTDIPKTQDYTEQQNERFVYIKAYTSENTRVITILVDKETRVMYMVYHEAGSYGGNTGITVMLNADGTPMIWEGEL